MIVLGVIPVGRCLMMQCCEVLGEPRGLASRAQAEPPQPSGPSSSRQFWPVTI